MSRSPLEVIIRILITVIDVILAYLMFSGAADIRRKGDPDTGTLYDTEKTEAIILNVCGVLHLVNAALLWA